MYFFLPSVQRRESWPYVVFEFALGAYGCCLPLPCFL